MHNNTQHSFATKYVIQPRFYAACCFALLSSTSIASAQDTLATPSFPTVPQLSSSNTTLPELTIQKETLPPLRQQEAQIDDTASPVSPKITQAESAAPIISATPAPAVASNNRLPSYGSWPKSLMFPEQEIQYMKTILDEYEATGEVPLSLQDISEVAVVEKAPTVEITEYPSFHLKSILYHSPKYWGIWINDIKITSRDNHTSDSEIKVVNVSKENVRFEWKPSDPAFMEAYTSQLPDLKEIAADTVLPIVNRTSHSARAATISEDKTTLYFSLRLNESFSTETFYTFDRKPPTLVYPSLDVPYSVDGKVTPTTAQVSPDISGGNESTTPANLDKTLDRIDASNAATPAQEQPLDKLKEFKQQQSPKDILESITPDAALESLTPEQAIKAIEAITK